jgi:hypothetical protein
MNFLWIFVKKCTSHLNVDYNVVWSQVDTLIKNLGWYPRSSHDLTLLLYLYPGDTRVFSGFLEAPSGAMGPVVLKGNKYEETHGTVVSSTSFISRLTLSPRLTHKTNHAERSAGWASLSGLYLCMLNDHPFE